MISMGWTVTQLRPKSAATMHVVPTVSNCKNSQEWLARACVKVLRAAAETSRAHRTEYTDRQDQACYKQISGSVLPNDDALSRLSSACLQKPALEPRGMLALCAFAAQRSRLCLTLLERRSCVVLENVILVKLDTASCPSAPVRNLALFVATGTM